MKNFTKLMFGVAVACLPAFALADTASTSVPTPVHVSPADNVALTTANFTSSDWTDVAVSSTTVSYHYESSHATTTNVDGSFSVPFLVSPLLASSSISNASTTEGIYYWHVRAVASSTGATSTWSTPWKVIVDNTSPTIPSALTLVSSVSPTSSTTNGSQSWAFGSSTDALSGVLKYEYSLNGTTTWINNALNTSFTTTLGIGSYQLFVHAIDRAGNVSGPISASFVVTASSTSATTTPPVVPPVNTNQCKKMGWKHFSGFHFKNQGRCVSFVEKMLRDKKQEENRIRQENRKKEGEARKNAEKREREVRALNSRHQENDDMSRIFSFSSQNQNNLTTVKSKNKNNNSEHGNSEGKGKGREGR
jgi:hypothetical protein